METADQMASAGHSDNLIWRLDSTALRHLHRDFISHRVARNRLCNPESDRDK